MERRDLSEHGKKLTERRALTSWRPQRERVVRIQKEADRERGTHVLETAEGVTCQDTERHRLTGGTHKLETKRGGACQDTEGN